MTKQSNNSENLISGRVASILNARELVVNIGADNGVLIGMKFKILSQEPINIIDPESGETLGVVDREKIRVKAIEVQNKITVCKTYRSHRVGGGPLWTSRLMDSLGSPPREIPETFKADSSSFPPPISEEESYVKRGDRVLQLTKSELDNE